MKKYIKSGYTGLPPQKSRLLIRYASTWDIRGKAWIKNEPWLANPDGYIEEATERQKRELADVNSAKNVVCEQLSALYDALCAKNATFSDCASALYTHLVSCGADKATVRKAEYCRSIGDEDGAQKLTQLWGLVISVLEQLSMVCGDSKATPERLLFMLRLAFSEYKVGTIPLFSDAVTVGDASMVRSGNVRAAILLGVNDGVFPASAENSGLLCDDELAALEQHGINMGDTSKKRRAQEKLQNGMSGFLTQPVLSAQAVVNLKKTRETLGEKAKILAGIMPVVSQRNAIFMENEVNGIHVDAAIIDRFAGLDRAAGEELGIEISVQAAKAALPYADGFYLMTPFNRVALMERFIARLKEEVIKD